MSSVSQQQLLVMMLGTMGSGKSAFARQLAVKTAAKRVNADIIRRELFKTYEEWIKPANKDQVFKVFNQEVRQLLQAGHSVIRDYQHDKRQDRDETRQMADEFGALPIMVWLKIPAEVAVKRALDRIESPDSIKFDEAFTKDAVKRHLERLEPPEPGELCLEIDSLWPFEKQYQAFAVFCASLS